MLGACFLEGLLLNAWISALRAGGGGWGGGGGGRHGRWQAPMALYTLEGETPDYRPEALNVSTCKAAIARKGWRADTASALQIALDGSELHPHDQELLYEASTLLELQGRPREAAAKLNALIALNATHSAALSSLALITCFRTELNVSKARELVDRARAADAANSRTLCVAGQIAQYGAQQLAEAKELYRQALQHDPSYFPALTHLGCLLHAEAALGVRASGKPRSGSVGGKTEGEGGGGGEVWEGEGVVGAEACFDRALRLMPLDAETLVAYAQLLMDTSSQAHDMGTSLAPEQRARRLEVAEKMLRRATLVSEHLVHPWLALARLLWSAKGDTAEAELVLIRACVAAWLWADAHPDDAVKFSTDIEGVKAGLDPADALTERHLNITNSLLDKAYALMKSRVEADGSKDPAATSRPPSRDMPLMTPRDHHAMMLELFAQPSSSPNASGAPASGMPTGARAPGGGRGLLGEGGGGCGLGAGDHDEGNPTVPDSPFGVLVPSPMSEVCGTRALCISMCTCMCMCIRL